MKPRTRSVTNYFTAVPKCRTARDLDNRPSPRAFSSPDGELNNSPPASTPSEATDPNRCARRESNPKPKPGPPPKVSAMHSDSSDDLTSLSWLHSLDMGGVVPHLAAPPTPPASPPLGNGYAEQCKRYEPPPIKIDYSLDGSVKPPYSYAALIGMAMKENANKMTLSAIYKWIKENFIFYKTADQSWQNSIRHNLSLNKCFMKVARAKDEPGKGGFWKLDPEYADTLVDGVFKKRRPSKTTSLPSLKMKKSKRPFTLTEQQRIQHQVQKQREKDIEEQRRQKEQEDAVRSLLQPVQAAYMPIPTNKPPVVSFVEQDITKTIFIDEQQVRDDLVWSSILGEDCLQDEWQCGSQEVVTDLTQSGDPSMYHVTTSSTHSVISVSNSSPPIMINYESQGNAHEHAQLQTLPSFELSPESLGVEEDLFGTPEYSETSNDTGDSLISTFDLGVGMELAASTGPSWEVKETDCSYGMSETGTSPKDGCPTSGDHQLPACDTITTSRLNAELVPMTESFTQLTPMEPANPMVQQPNQAWSAEQAWDEAKTFSLLEAILDFDSLIDMDVL